MKTQKLILTTLIITIFLSNFVLAQIDDCQEKWKCTKWSSCKNGLKTRKCTDENRCGTELYKPFESLPCSTEEIAESASANKTSLILISITIVIIILIIIGLAYYFVRKRKK